MKLSLGFIVIYLITQLPCTKAHCNNKVELARFHNEALIGHLIRTFAANSLNCIEQCGDTDGCRSINSYKDKNGREMCDLNKSSKTAHPDSIVSKSGYEYDEIIRRNDCTSQDCLGTAAVDWQKFNSSLFKLFKEPMTWIEARKFCRSLQGDLASIASRQEKDFISTLLTSAPRGNTSNTKLIGLWKLDGTDMNITFFGEAKIKFIDGYKALYLDGKNTNYATTPTFGLIGRGFTVGAWVKLLTPASTGLIFGDWSYPYQLAVQVDNSGSILFQLNLYSNLIVKVQYSSIPFNVWVHVMASWGARSRILLIRINGKEKARYEVPSNITKVKLVYTGHKFDIGLQRNQSTVFHGYVRELAVYTWPAEDDRDASRRIGRWDKYDGAWIGLNDMTNEGSFTFSDGSAITYNNWADKEPNDLYKFEDCVAVSLNNKTHPWNDKVCALELPFVCRKKK